MEVGHGRAGVTINLNDRGNTLSLSGRLGTTTNLATMRAHRGRTPAFVWYFGPNRSPRLTPTWANGFVEYDTYHGATTVQFKAAGTLTLSSDGTSGSLTPPSSGRPGRGRPPRQATGIRSTSPLTGAAPSGARTTRASEVAGRLRSGRGVRDRPRCRRSPATTIAVRQQVPIHLLR